MLGFITSVQDGVGNSIQQEIGKEEVNCLFTNGTVLCVKNSKGSTKKTSELIANLAKLQDTKSTQN